MHELMTDAICPAVLSVACVFADPNATAHTHIPLPLASPATVVTSQPRMSLLLLLVTALSGVWSVEQPSGSFLAYFPRFRSVMQMLGEGAVPGLG